MPFAPGDERINRDGRPPSLMAVLGRLAVDSSRAEKAIEAHHRRLQAAMLLGMEPPPLPDDYPGPAERELVRLNADLRHMRNTIEALQAHLDVLPLPAPQKAARRSRASEDGAIGDALEQAASLLELGRREEEQRLMTAGALLDRAVPEDVSQ